MKRLGTLLAASLLVAGTNTAWAATVNGMIKSVDDKSHELTLDDGRTYLVAENVTLEGLKPGDRVKVNAEMKNGKHFVDKVEQTSSAAMNGTATSSSGGAISGSSGGVGGSLNDSAAPAAKTPTD